MPVHHVQRFVVLAFAPVPVEKMNQFLKHLLISSPVSAEVSAKTMPGYSATQSCASSKDTLQSARSI